MCRTAPIPGMARYASRWVWLFHRKVPTRSLSPTPMASSALASRSARSATSVNEAWVNSPAGPVMVITWLSP